MGRMIAYLPDKLEQRFRIAVTKKGGKKGDLSKTFEEAIVLWLEREKIQNPPEDPA